MKARCLLVGAVLITALNCSKKSDENVLAQPAVSPLIFSENIILKGKKIQGNSLQGTASYVIYGDEGYDRFVKFDHSGNAVDSFYHGTDGMNFFEVVNDNIIHFKSFSPFQPVHDIKVIDMNYGDISLHNFPDIDLKSGYYGFCSDGIVGYAVTNTNGIIRYNLSDNTHTSFASDMTVHSDLLDIENNNLFAVTVNSGKYELVKWDNSMNKLASVDISATIGVPTYYTHSLEAGSKYVFISVSDKVYIYNQNDLSYVGQISAISLTDAFSSVLDTDFNDGKLFIMRQQYSGQIFVQVFIEQ